VNAQAIIRGSRIGHHGGKPVANAKRLPSRHEALRHYKLKPGQAVIPMEKLQDGRWYVGIGRNSDLGRWDAEAQCFWVISFANFADPARYPKGSTRIVRLKQEDCFTSTSGTFKPLELLKCRH
jgi:hypothetical protein